MLGSSEMLQGVLVALAGLDVRILAKLKATLAKSTLPMVNIRVN